jgi:glycine betaine/proline transport system permease protein
MTTRVPAIPRRVWALGLVLVVGLLYLLFADQYLLPNDNSAPLFRTIKDIKEWIDANRNSNVVFSAFVGGIRVGVTTLYDFVLFVLRFVSWPGLIVIGAVTGFVVGRWRLMLLLGTGFLLFGMLGFWERSMETLALTLAAVTISLAIGIPLGVLAGRSDRFMSLIQPVLDVMQIMPTFSYLAPLAMIFLIGPHTAIIVTMIYAIAPAIRITALGIRGVAKESVEAAVSLGSTRRQLLTKVQLPMARRTIILGINQTMMMALSMVVITALVNAPGLGKDIFHALQNSDVGLAFSAGLVVVIMAVMLDRLTTQASERMDPAKSAAAGAPKKARAWLRPVMVAIPVVGVALGRLAVGEADFPADIRYSFREPINTGVTWIAKNFFFLTDWIKNTVSTLLVNPIEGFLTHAPWWLIFVLVVGIALLVAGRRQAIMAAICLALLIWLQVWEHSMQTLAQVLIATAMTLGVGLVLGIGAARSDGFSRILRPILDAAQTLPAFVYLIPALALFLPGRFTAIIAAVIYSVPPVSRLVEVGIRTVPATIREAALAAGATPGQLLWKVELPLARSSILVAANQGIIMVLAMVVVGGLVGGQALGFDVIKGFVREDWFGQGLAAGLAIVVMGIMLDRITQGAGSRDAQGASSGGSKRAA